jgi:hypothetical protein
MEHYPTGISTPQPLQEKDILCLGYLQRVFDLLDSLHLTGCQRDKAGNRRLHLDDYVKLMLVYIWNPLIVSVHDLQQAAALPRVAKALGIKRFSAASFSESVTVFDPRQLIPIIASLAGELMPLAGDPRLATVKDALTLVDGTVLTGLARLAKAACPGLPGEIAPTRYTTSRAGRAVHGWRLHTQLDLQTFSVHRLDRTGARNAGAAREHQVLQTHLEPGRCYVCDGGYATHELFDAITDKGSSHVIRAADNAVFQVREERLLSQQALDAGIVRDAIVVLDGARHPVRCIQVQVTPHPRRTRQGVKQVDRLIIITNLLDLPAELVALIYQQRYLVELFFRIFKQLLGMRHLLSQRAKGLDIQIYCSLIVCLLIQLISGKKPNKAMRNMMSWYLLGLADEQEVIAFLHKPDNTGIKKRAEQELLKKLGF